MGLNKSVGYDNLTDYLFGPKKKHHKFCKTCGTSVLIDFKRMDYGETNPEKDTLAVNVRFLSPFRQKSSIPSVIF